MNKVFHSASFLRSLFSFSIQDDRQRGSCKPRPMGSSFLRFCLLLAVGGGLTLSSQPVQAASDTWNLAGTTIIWSDSNNWAGTNTPPTPLSGDSLVFATSGAGGVNLNNNLTTSSFNLGGITFNSGASAFVISGSAFALSGGVTNNGTNLETINDPFSMSAVQTFTTNAGGGNLALGGSISGAGGIIAAGTGILTLSSSNTYTGATSVTSGTLSVSSIITSGSSSLGNATSAVTLNGGVLSYTGNTATYARGFTIGASGGEFDVSTSGQTVTVSSSLSLASGGMTFGGAGSTNVNTSGTAGLVALSGASTLAKNGAGTLTITTSNVASISGAVPIVINAGTLTESITTKINISNPLGTGQITIAPGATLNCTIAAATDSYQNAISIGNATGTAIVQSSSGALTFSSPVTLNNAGSTLQVNNTNSSVGSYLTMSGGISGAGNIVANGTGAGTPINLTGTTVNNSGTITNIGTNAGGVLTISGGTVGSNVNGIYTTGVAPTNVSDLIQVNSGGTTLQTSNGSMGISGGINGIGNLMISATTGAITISGGSVNNSGTITNYAASSGNGPVTISANLGPNVGLVNQNNGYDTLILSGTSNTNVGGVQLSNGVLKLSSSTAVGAAASLLTLNAGTLDSGVANLVIANNNPVAIGGPFTFQGSNNLNLGAGTVLLNTPSTITVSANTLTFGGNIAATANGITKAGPGALTLNGSNAYTGLTVIAGTVNLGQAGAAGVGTMTIGNIANTGSAATLNYNGVSSGGTLAGAINVVGNGADTLSVTGWNPTFTGPITLGISGGSSNLILLTNNAGGSPLGITGGISGTGNLTITSSAANAVNSLITLSGSPINNTGTITNNGGATLASSAAFGGIGTLISAPIGSNVTSLSQNSATVPLFLSGTNTYTAATTVTAGILDFMNTNAMPSSGTTTVAAAGILALGVGAAAPYYSSSDVDALFFGHCGRQRGKREHECERRRRASIRRQAISRMPRTSPRPDR